MAKSTPRPQASPDQNDPTGHSRPGSPTYHDGQSPSHNQKPHTDLAGHIPVAKAAEKADPIQESAADQARPPQKGS